MSSSLLSNNVDVKIYRTIILPVVLRRCETWSLKLREELRLSVIKNGVLCRIFGPKRNGVTGNGEDYTMRSLMVRILHPVLFGRSNQKNEISGHVTVTGDRRHAHRILVGRIEGRRTLGRPKPIYKDNIKMYFQEVGWGHGLD